MSEGHQIISLREFARRLDVDEKSVRKAIEAKKIINGIGQKENGRPYIVFEVAITEWQNNYGLDSGNQLKNGTIDFDAVREKYGVPVERKKKDKNSDEFDPPPSKPEADAKNDNIQTSKINRQRSTVRLQKEAIELQKLKGQLVEKEKVNNELFEAGKTIRESILSIPDRIIDDIMSAHDRDEAHTLLYKELEQSLATLATAANKIADL